ncbi:tumor protein D53 isoform X2 [Sphaeramia orbicularis]|uniref:tumor protein D53 isoform X2 n=1 Tax=Sphaeramia orbicularis TaxID=375764 RepID=UPI00117F4710|nr:tumor protein D53 isoform X2 [Sphaeramia orbicularis]
METRQQELYSSVLSDAVVDWGDTGPEEEWVNSAPHEGEQVRRHPHGDGLTQMFHNGENLTETASDMQTDEWDKASPVGKDRWGRTPLSHSDNWVMSTTWDMQLDSSEGGHLSAGFMDSQPLREADEDLVSEVNLTNSVMTEEEREEIQQELAKLEEEINTLKQVLSSKEKQHAELKQKLGITPLSEIRNNFSRGWQDMQSSMAYKKTSETLTTAGQKTTAAFSTLGTAISRKFGDMRSNSIGYSIKHSMSMPTMRNSPSFKSFEEKVESTVSTIKTKVGGTSTGGSFEEVLSSAANASNQDMPTNNVTDASEGQC